MSAPATKKTSPMVVSANVVLDLAESAATTPEQKADIAKVRAVFDPSVSYMDLTDDEAGRYMKWIGGIIREFAAKDFDDQDGTGTALTTMGLLQIFKRMRDAGAHHGTFSVKKATFGGVDGGNWRITLEQVDDNGVAIQHPDETITAMSTMDPINPERKPTVDGSGRA